MVSSGSFQPASQPQPSPLPPLNAPMLWAQAHQARCDGPDKCHWCGAPCARFWIHDDAPPIPFVRSNTTALCPGNSYVCTGCWLFRRKKNTIFFLSSKEFKDGQAAEDWSWWIAPEVARAIRLKEDLAALHKLLLSPPLRFGLALRGKPGDESPPKLRLQLATVNDVSIITGETKLAFSCMNVPFHYTIYELGEAMKGGVEGIESGSRLLAGMFKGLVPPEPEGKGSGVDKRGRGRPAKDYDVIGGANPHRTIRASGMPCLTTI